MKRLASISLCGAMAIAACGGNDPATPEDARARVDSTLPRMSEQITAATDALTRSATLEQFEAGMDVLSNTLPEFAFFGDDEETLFRSPLAFAEGAEETNVGQELANFLNTHVFTDANDEGDGCFQIDANEICDGDAECVNQVTEAELRVCVELVGNDGANLVLTIGSARHEPLALEVRSDRLNVVLDLNETRKSFELLASIANEPVELPAVMEGILAASIVIHRDNDVSLTFAIREDIRIDGNIPEVGTVKMSVTAKDPALSLRLNGVDSELTLAIDFGNVIVDVPWILVAPDSNVVGERFVIDWGGLSATVALAEGDGDLTLTNLGLGDRTSRIAIDDHNLVTVDLNADTGRRFDLTITPTTELPTFAFSPSMTLSMGVDFSPLAVDEEVPPALLAQVYTVDVTGTAPLLQPVEGASHGGLAVVSGHLRIGSSIAPDDEIVVEPGQCLLGDVAEPGEHELLGQLAAGACP